MAMLFMQRFLNFSLFNATFIDGDDDLDVWRQLLRQPGSGAILIRILEEHIQRICFYIIV